MNDFVPSSEETADLNNQKKIQLRKDAFKHFRFFLFASLALIAANMFTNFHHPYNYWWCLFPILAWGSFVLVHAIVVSYFPNMGGENWAIKEIQKTDSYANQAELPSNMDFPEASHLELKQMEKRKHYKDEDLV